jgi:transposase
MKEIPVKTRRKFDETFKREAVHTWLQSGKSAEVIAEELGLQANQLYAWKKAFGLGGAGLPAAERPKAGSTADLQSQLDAARREIARISEQRDILKKTLGILSEPSSTGMSGFRR